MSEQNGRLNLKAMQEKTPVVNPLEALRRSMANALCGSVSENDMTKVVAKLKEQALAGDKKAMEIFFKLMLGDGKTPEPPKEPQGIQALADAIQDMVDEIRIAKAAPPKSRAAAINAAKDDDDDD